MGMNDDAASDSKITNNLEGNVMCALFVLVTGVVLDALCALPGTWLTDVPASLRTTSIVLIVLLGSPAMSISRIHVLEQRIVLAVFLGASALIGKNAAETTSRNADALFSLVGVLASVLALATNGIVQKDMKQSREQLSALTGALLFYIGMRCIRNSFALPDTISGFTVSELEFTVRGYGAANELTVAGLSFSGCIISAFGMIVLLNHDMMLHTGSHGLSVVASILACCAFVGSFAVQISTYALMESLPALFSEAACNGDYEYCIAAYRSRRLFVASNNSSCAWIGAIAISTFAFSNTRKFTSRRQHFEFIHNYSYTSFQSMIAMIATLACLVIVFWFTDKTTDMNYSDAELTLLIVSIPLSIMAFPVSSCLLHISGQLMYVVTRVQSDSGFSWIYFTHHSLVATLLLTVVTMVLVSVSYTLYSFMDARFYIASLERATGIVLTMLVSIQLFLTVATMCMSSGYTGTYYLDDKGSWRISGYEFSVQHSVSFFFSASIYACRYEHAMLSQSMRRFAWFCIPLVLGVTWTVCISVVTHEGSPYTQWVDVGSFIIGISASVLSWVGVGVFLTS